MTHVTVYEIRKEYKLGSQPADGRVFHSFTLGTARFALNIILSTIIWVKYSSERRKTLIEKRKINRAALYRLFNVC